MSSSEPGRIVDQLLPFAVFPGAGAIVQSLFLAYGAPSAGSMRHVWPESGYASLVCPQRRSETFIP